MSNLWQLKQGVTIKTVTTADQCFFGNYSKYLAEDGIHFLFVKPTYKDLRRPFGILEFDHLDKTRHIRDISNTQYINDSKPLCSFMKYALYLRANHIVHLFM